MALTEGAIVAIKLIADAIIAASAATGTAVGISNSNQAADERRKAQESKEKADKERQKAIAESYADRRRNALASIIKSHLGRLPDAYKEPAKVYQPLEVDSTAQDVLSGVSDASAAASGIASTLSKTSAPSTTTVTPNATTGSPTINPNTPQITTT